MESKSKSPITKLVEGVLVSASQTDKKNCTLDGSEITVKQFLDFLKTAYQVNESVEEEHVADGMKGAIDWIKLKESELVKPCEVACQTADKGKSTGNKELHRRKSDGSLNTTDSAENVKRKLSDVLSEGLFDSVLPYMIGSNQSAQIVRKTPQKIGDRGSTSSNERNLGRRKSQDSSGTSVRAPLTKTDSEVIIHVCDEAKHTKKDFVCNQKLLVEKMGYFAEITAGQRLEEMDISVHCDIGIFEWLMRWVKKEQMTEEEEPPELDPHVVIAVLVSAAFLQMEPLLQECLLYCHRHMNEILRTSSNLSCINETVLTRLAAMYTNSEVESIRDRKDKIQTRLYFKLVQSLCEPEPESMRGHWRSLARVFRCGRCQQLVSPSVASKIPCAAACTKILYDGSVTYEHERDSSWNINKFIEQLYKDLKTWRKVYWRLWGEAHFLYCSVCKRYFPVHQISWCRFHPDPPQYFTVEAQRAPLPVGRHPCCGERAFRFEILTRESGCEFRDHTPLTETIRDAAIYQMLETYRSLIEEEAVKLIFPERLTRLVGKAQAGEDLDTCDGITESGSFWWEGLELIPPRPKLGLFGSFGDFCKKSETPKSRSPSPVLSLDEEEDGEDDDDNYTDCSDSSESEDSSTSTQRSEESHHSPVSKQKSPRAKCVKKRGRLWQNNLSARSNQDLQRSYEEASLKQIAALLGRRTHIITSSESQARFATKTWPRHVTPPGGVWVRLESEWRERQSIPPLQRLRGVLTIKPKIKPIRPM